MGTSFELRGKVNEIINEAKESIIALMKGKGYTSVCLMNDNDGRNWEDEDYDEDFVKENKVFATSYDLDGTHSIYITDVQINRNNELEFFGENDYGEEDRGNILLDANLYIGVLCRIEQICKNK